MKRLVGFAGMLLATSAAAGEPGNAILRDGYHTSACHGRAEQCSRPDLRNPCAP